MTFDSFPLSEQVVPIGGTSHRDNPLPPKGIIRMSHGDYPDEAKMILYELIKNK